MQPFVFHNPTKVLFGPGVISAIGKETRNWGQRALLVYGQNSARASGRLDQIITLLREAGVDPIEHGGVRANPRLEHVRQGIELAKTHRIEVIVGVGGGSALDTAKAIAAGTMATHDVWKFFIGKKGVKTALPVLTVPTVAASGSEMNSGMVLTNESTREKLGFGHRLLFPKTSLLDPETTHSVPPMQTACGAVDIFCHLLEFYLTASGAETPIQDRFMEGLADTVISASRRCLVNPHDAAARADLLWCASLALSGLTTAGLGRVSLPIHLIEHSLSALYDIPHGAGMAVLLPGWLAEYAPAYCHRLASMARGLLHCNDPDPHRAAEAVIDHIRRWLLDLGLPRTLDDLGIPSDDLVRIAAHTTTQARTWRLRAHTPETVIRVLRRCIEPSSSPSACNR
ncbi:MAG: iron-containing alcohol dehydrogenase [Desulfobulbus sp.]|jgi:alcohol dehydrogenase YqhD (iron-dependent ADH family)